MGSPGRPKGTRERTANWYARLWFDLAMVKKNQRGRTRNLAGTIKQLQDTFPQRYRHMTAKSLREYLTRPPFLNLTLEEAVQFILSCAYRALLLHNIARRIVNASTLSGEEATKLVFDLIAVQLGPLAAKFALSESEAETLIKAAIVRNRGTKGEADLLKAAALSRPEQHSPK
jgi:hypothetical protein